MCGLFLWLLPDLVALLVYVAKCVLLLVLLVLLQIDEITPLVSIKYIVLILHIREGSASVRPF